MSLKKRFDPVIFVFVVQSAKTPYSFCIHVSLAIYVVWHGTNTKFIAEYYTRRASRSVCGFYFRLVNILCSSKDDEARSRLVDPTREFACHNRLVL